ncbi:MAG: cyclic nucleotide-binding domain-containing protein [Desulfobulbaceae bacterium]|uniref:Cyclic nucleotide-binding domain-containing protein n=1 Tax=Candidatus Desulfobia pelagia TaxID=2841692 RepID=A0A8J6NC29_9BACT|nr:cyclic nucleotide-binding domain-containing protein [Candidatus Desulfobia pelagia]
MKDLPVTYHDFLACLPGISEEEYLSLSAFLTYSVFPRDTVVMQEGDPGDFMGFLVRGKMAIRKETNFDGKYILIAILEKGSIFGEISVVEPNPRTATVSALEECHALILSHNNAQKVISGNPELGVKLLSKILRVVGVRLQKSAARIADVL